MKIFTYPSEILRKKSKVISNPKNPEIKDFAMKLFKTMVREDGLGLAAPQVGKNIKIIAINTHAGDKIFINPRIIYKSFFKKESGEEGCLSLPGIYGLVKRHKKIIVIYTNLDGKFKTIKAKGLMARVMQHEIDHLKGILFTDKIQKFTKGEEKFKSLKDGQV